MLNSNKNCDCGCGGKTDCVYLTMPNCKECGDPVTSEDHGDLCFFCRELENNRRYRLHHRIAEYAEA